MQSCKTKNAYRNLQEALWTGIVFRTIVYLSTKYLTCISNLLVAGITAAMPFVSEVLSQDSSGEDDTCVERQYLTALKVRNHTSLQKPL